MGRRRTVRTGISRREMLRRTGMAAAGVGVAAMGLGGVTYATGTEQFIPPGPGTLSAAIAAANDGDKLKLTAGTYTETSSLNINKSLTIEGTDGTIIESVDVLFSGAGKSWVLKKLDWNCDNTTNEWATINMFGGPNESQRNNVRILECTFSGGWYGLGFQPPHDGNNNYYDKMDLQHSKFTSRGVEFITGVALGAGAFIGSYSAFGEGDTGANRPNSIKLSHCHFECISTDIPFGPLFGLTLNNNRGDFECVVDHCTCEGSEAGLWVGRGQYNGATFMNNIFRALPKNVSNPPFPIEPVAGAILDLTHVEPPYVVEENPDGYMIDSLFKNNKYEGDAVEGLTFGGGVSNCTFIHESFTGNYSDAEIGIWALDIYSVLSQDNVFVLFEGAYVRDDTGLNHVITKGRARNS
jgi:hypothetical protein